MYQILVVDDEQLTLDYLRITIPEQDPIWEVAHTCLDGISALAWLETHSVDLVITDIKMPEMSGLQLCQEIKKRRPGQKIVILSGYDDFKFAQEAIRYDVRDYLLKPIPLSTCAPHSLKSGKHWIQSIRSLCLRKSSWNCLIPVKDNWHVISSCLSSKIITPRFSRCIRFSTK